jgi:hypothetical protein
MNVWHEILEEAKHAGVTILVVAIQINICASMPFSTENSWPRPDISLRSTRSPYRQRRPNRVSAPDTTGMPGWNAPFVRTARSGPFQFSNQVS